MNAKELFLTAISSLKFHKLRTFLTMIGIIIGISSVVVILSVGDGFKEYVHTLSEEASANTITIEFHPKNENINYSLLEPFTKNDLNTIGGLSGVSEVKPSAGIMGFGNMSVDEGSFYNKKNTLFIDKYGKDSPKLDCGRWFSSDDSNRDYIVLNYDAAKELFTEPKDALGKAITLKGQNFEVIGVVNKEGEGAFALMGLNKSYVSEENLKEIRGDDPIFSIDVSVKEGADKKQFFDEIQRDLKSVHGSEEGDYILKDPQESAKAIDSIIGALTKFVAFITGISLIVGGIGVMNIMYVSVSERKREIGIRRAIGASPKSILLQFLIEAVIVTLIGGIIGIIVGFLISTGAGMLMPFKPVLTFKTVLGATLISILEGVIFGVIPARNACKMDPIKAIYK